MADLLGMDPGRIDRLRSPERLTYLDPARVWDAVTPVETGIIVDIGTGVGFLALPFARRFPRAMVYACDILEGMLGLLAEEAAREDLANLRTLSMEPAAHHRLEGRGQRHLSPRGTPGAGGGDRRSDARRGIHGSRKPRRISIPQFPDRTHDLT
jgi:hypothetical protein